MVEDKDIGSLTAQNLESALVKLYTVILRFLIRANQLYQSSIKRLGHGIRSPDVIKDFIDECTKQEIQVSLEASNYKQTMDNKAHAGVNEKLRVLLDELRSPISYIDSGVMDIRKMLTKTEQLSLLRWVSDIHYESDHKSARKEPVNG